MSLQIIETSYFVKGVVNFAHCLSWLWPLGHDMHSG